MTVYDVLNQIDKDLTCCDEIMKRSRRRKTLFNLVKVTARKKALVEMKNFILENH